MENRFNKIQQMILDANMGKKINFYNGLGELSTGYIQGADLVGSERFFIYRVSIAKNPKGEFNMNNGRWFWVPPINVIF